MKTVTVEKGVKLIEALAMAFMEVRDTKEAHLMRLNGIMVLMFPDEKPPTKPLVEVVEVPPMTIGIGGK